MPRKMDIAEKVKNLRLFYMQEKRAPGYTEMLKLFGYRSKNAVYGLLQKLEDLGYVNRVNGKTALTGKITDKQGQPIWNAHVLFLDQNGNDHSPPIGTITDLDGNFSLSDIPRTATIQIQHIGFKTLFIPAVAP